MSEISFPNASREHVNRRRALAPYQNAAFKAFSAFCRTGGPTGEWHFFGMPATQKRAAKSPTQEGASLLTVSFDSSATKGVASVCR